MTNPPALLKTKHPLYTGKYKIATFAIEEMANTINQWMISRSPGGMIYSHPRMGKTCAIQYLLKNKKEIFGSIPAYILTCEKSAGIAEGRFLEELLYAAEYGLTTGTIPTKRNRLVNLYAEAALQAEEYRVLLFIDEAQWLNENELRWLMGIHNKLNLKDIALFVVLVGQQRELLAKKSSLLTIGELQIVGRFMNHQYQFHGINTSTAMKQALESYDEYAIFPEESNWTYTRFFLPKAFEKGLRLNKDAGLIWRKFKELNKKINSKSKNEFPMQAFVAFTSVLLSGLSDRDSSSLKILESDIEDALTYVVYGQLQHHNNAKDALNG